MSLFSSIIAIYNMQYIFLADVLVAQNTAQFQNTVNNFCHFITITLLIG